MCNGCKILVTENLFDALDQLSQMPDVDFLWIDALCINQEDLDERASQVLIMGEIYASSVETIVWLGEPNAHFEDFYWTVTSLLPKLEDMAQKRGWKTIYDCSLFDPDVLQRLSMEVPHQKILGYGQFRDTNC
jgi:hypothetical protein